MRLFEKNLDTDVLIVAEIGVNHEGDVGAASRLLRLAAEAGATIFPCIPAFYNRPEGSDEMARQFAYTVG